MNYRQYTPHEIAAFLEPRAADIVKLIRRGMNITGCNCGLKYIKAIETGNITTRADLVQLYKYLIDLSIGIKRLNPADPTENAAAFSLLYKAGGMADFLTAEEEDSRKTAAAMLNAAAARHAAAPAVANTRAPRRAAAPVIHACSAVIGQR